MHLQTARSENGFDNWSDAGSIDVWSTYWLIDPYFVDDAVIINGSLNVLRDAHLLRSEKKGTTCNEIFLVKAKIESFFGLLWTSLLIFSFIPTG